jgi:hypothetical protein
MSWCKTNVSSTLRQALSVLDINEERGTVYMSVLETQTEQTICMDAQEYDCRNENNGRVSYRSWETCCTE